MRNAEPPEQDEYPPGISSAEDRRRWDLAVAIATEWYGPDDHLLVRMTARSLFDSEIDT